MMENSPLIQHGIEPRASSSEDSIGNVLKKNLQRRTLGLLVT